MEAIINTTKIPHAGGEFSFQYPAFEGTYGNVAEQIDKAGLKRPNSSEIASLVYDALQNKDGKYKSEIISILEKNWFWEFTGNFYLPKSDEEINNGVILETNPKIENGKLVMDKDSLIKRLEKKDSLVKFVSFGFKTGKQTWQELSKNPYIQARYGEEGAEKIVKVASRYRNNPYIWSFKSVDKEKTSLSVLGRSWDFFGRLYIVGVDGGDWRGGDEGHAFGVKK